MLTFCIVGYVRAEEHEAQLLLVLIRLQQLVVERVVSAAEQVLALRIGESHCHVRTDPMLDRSRQDYGFRPVPASLFEPE